MMDTKEENTADYQQWSYVTKFRTGDLALGLLAGALAHFVCWVASLAVIQTIVRTLPTPTPLWYGAWAFAVAATMLLIGLFFRRYPALMSGFIIGTVPAAAINLFMVWFVADGTIT